MAIRPVQRPRPNPSPSGAGEEAGPSGPRRRIRPVAHPARSLAEPGPAAETEGEDYKVGKGKPPLHTRFRKGQSGNPRGRPPGAKGLKKLVRENLLTKVSARTADGIKRISRVEAVVHKQLELAMKGNQRAVSQLLALYAAAVPDEPEQEVSKAPGAFDATDEAILAFFREELLREAGGKQ